MLERNLPVVSPVMRAIGVPEIAGWLRGEIGRDEALEAGRASTRQYAKRQYTWFNRQPPASWPRFREPLEGAGFASALQALQTGLQRSRPA